MPHIVIRDRLLSVNRHHIVEIAVEKHNFADYMPPPYSTHQVYARLNVYFTTDADGYHDNMHNRTLYEGTEAECVQFFDLLTQHGDEYDFYRDTSFGTPLGYPEFVKTQCTKDLTSAVSVQTAIHLFETWYDRTYPMTKQEETELRDYSEYQHRPFGKHATHPDEVQPTQFATYFDIAIQKKQIYNQPIYIYTNDDMSQGLETIYFPQVRIHGQPDEPMPEVVTDYLERYLP